MCVCVGGGVSKSRILKRRFAKKKRQLQSLHAGCIRFMQQDHLCKSAVRRGTKLTYIKVCVMTSESSSFRTSYVVFALKRRGNKS